ncbi:DM13 domain-containing protein [Deinococcus sp. UYEF24]
MTKFNTAALTLIAALTLTSGLVTSVLAAPATSAFHSLSAPTSGTVSVSTVGGQSTLTLKGLKTEVGPDLQVRLYKLAAPAVKEAQDKALAAAPYVKVGLLKTFSGNFSFKLPAGTKLNEYKSVVIWCDQVKTAFGAADL